MARKIGAGHVIVAALGIVAGLALGGLAPRGESRTLRARIAELEDQECSSPSLGRDVASVFRGRPWEPPAAPEPDLDVYEGDPDDDEAEPGLRVQVGDGDPGGASPPPEESLELMRTAMEARRAQARQALREQAGASDAQMDSIDAVTDTMNAELAVLAEEFVETVQLSDGEPERRDMMVFASETLNVLLDAEDRIYDTLEPDQRADLEDSTLDPLSHVDASIVDVLGELDTEGR